MRFVVERGWDVRLEEVLAAAEVKSASLCDFSNVAELCIAIYVANIAEFDRIVFRPVERVKGWPDRLRVSAYAALRYVRDRPLEARFNFIEMLGGGERAQVHRDRYIKRIVDLIDEGRGCLEDPDSLSSDLASTIFGSIYLFLQAKLRSGHDIETIDRFVPDLMYMAVLPYLGPELAERERTISPCGLPTPATTAWSGRPVEG